MTKWWRLVGAIVVAELAGGIGGLFTASKIPTWYALLTKPTWNPPAAVFAPVWTILYLLMGVSLWLVWEAKQSDDRRTALTLFWWQLAVNVLWSVVFFGLESPGLAVIVILVLLALIGSYVAKAWKLNSWAGIVMLPYIAWVSFATALTIAIWWLNR